MKKTVASIADLLKEGRTYLKSNGVLNQVLITEVLLTHLLKTKRTFLYENGEMLLSPTNVMTYHKLLDKFVAGVPIAYLVGKKEFMSLPFLVNQHTLIPRPETETLIEETLKLITQQKLLRESEELYVLDIGTGCGNIAISLAKLSPKKNIRVFASDISKNTLKIALQNARLNGVENRVTFCQGDIFEAFNKYRLKGKVNFILSNPPYIPNKDSFRLPLNVRKYEPKMALYSGEKGTYFHEKIIREAPQYLKENGYLLLEIGFKQTISIIEIIKQTNLFATTRVLNDYNQIPRVICAQMLTRRCLRYSN